MPDEIADRGSIAAFFERRRDLGLVRDVAYPEGPA